MHTISLSNKVVVPLLGFGTWRLETNEAKQAVYTAIKVGYRHIDCASVYENQKEVGEGIAAAIKDGLVAREDLFITSKLWNNDHAPQDARTALQHTLTDLQLEYLDLYLVHWAVAFEHGDELEPLDANGVARFASVPLQETWRVMEDFVEQGLVRSIGVANYSAVLLLDLFTYATIKPVMNQIEVHPYHAQNELIAFCSQNGIAVTAYSPLSSSDTPVLADPTIRSIAQQHGKTPAQIVLRWAYQRGTPAIPKAASVEHMTGNFSITDFELRKDDMQRLAALDRRLITCNPIEWWGFPYFS